MVDVAGYSAQVLGSAAFSKSCPKVTASVSSTARAILRIIVLLKFVVPLLVTVILPNWPVSLI